MTALTSPVSTTPLPARVLSTWPLSTWAPLRRRPPALQAPMHTALRRMPTTDGSCCKSTDAKHPIEREVFPAGAPLYSRAVPALRRSIYPSLWHLCRLCSKIHIRLQSVLLVMRCRHVRNGGRRAHAGKRRGIDLIEAIQCEASRPSKVAGDKLRDATDIFGLPTVWKWAVSDSTRLLTGQSAMTVCSELIGTWRAGLSLRRVWSLAAESSPRHQAVPAWNDGGAKDALLSSR